ncbi:MAG: Na/Pi cotransporter family protein [Candidatus Fermentibacter sp.]|nr:Na/Pi cotransporter family protein [Candidatus Fermentibacter sp.]
MITGLMLILLLIGAGSPAQPSGILVETTGGEQTGSVGRLLDEPLVVLLSDSVSGIPLVDVPVVFSIEPGSGSLIPVDGHPSTSILTDSSSGDVYQLMVETDSGGTAFTGLRLPASSGDVLTVAEISLHGTCISTVRFESVAIDLRTIIFEMVGGLALFLFGMKLMSEGLMRVAGNRMRTILSRITSNRVMGLLAGALVTAIIQSSSATTVILVSFVNTGLMTLQQAVGVILGANIGTTMTGQLIAFKITEYAYPGIALGLLMSFLGRSSTVRFWGRVTIGLGLLLLGMNVMKGSLEPLQNSLPVRNFFTTFSSSPFLGILAGTLVTCIIQSSSATVGLTMTLAGTGLISLQGAVYLVLGDNIGTTITAQLAAIGTNRSARRAAMAHSLFNLIGAIYFGLLLVRPDSFYMRVVEGSSADPLRQVANAHSLFNIFNAALFLPLVPLLTRLSKLLVPGEDPISSDQTDVKLSDKLLDTPVLAVDEINRTVVRMADYTRSTVTRSFEHFFEGRPKADEILTMESRVDEMQSTITIYATKLFSRDLSDELSLRLPVLLHSINDLERISDNAVNVVETRERIEGKLQSVDPSLLESARNASETVAGMLDRIVEALDRMDTRAAGEVLALEEKLNGIDEQCRAEYTSSLCGPRPDGLAGLAVHDFVNYCERMGDHLTNIAQSVIGGGVWHSEEEN